ncbi:hypothetical protein SORBI_3010G026850 [Sorghum bicolor]|uniref:Uncharacterized protein n=1 Tax=Sorghum bicolor TaxID=4558 RepID=A0A1W0VR59_SORBI|nr:hypothetical protein SORBI_3010G026850 [Sorghum bicolor]
MKGTGCSYNGLMCNFYFLSGVPSQGLGCKSSISVKTNPFLKKADISPCSQVTCQRTVGKRPQKAIDGPFSSWASHIYCMLGLSHILQIRVRVHPSQIPARSSLSCFHPTPTNLIGPCPGFWIFPKIQK